MSGKDEIGGFNGDVTLSAAAAASLLLGSNDHAEEARWQELQELQLDKEITIYREGIRALSTKLEAEGVPVTLDDTQAACNTRTQIFTEEVWLFALPL